MHPLSRRQAAGMVGAALLAGAAAPAPAQAVPPFDRLEIVAPAVTGSGWTQTAEAMKQALASGGPRGRVEILQIPGAGGTVGVNSHQRFAAELASGRLRALAISSPERVPGVGIPTFKEQGVPLQLVDRRGVMAPPGSTQPRPRRLATWSRGWSRRRPGGARSRSGAGFDLHLPAAEFTAFLAEDGRELRQLLTEAALVK